MSARMPPQVPLLRHASPDAAFAHGPGHTVSVAGFLADVAALAARLPERPHLVNFCSDRYHFTVALAAALVRGQVSLLPPHRTPDFLRRLVGLHPAAYCLTDQPDEHWPIETVCYPDTSPGTIAETSADPRGDRAIPAFASDQVAAIAFTSGTTGEPTAHVKTWGSLARGAAGEALSLGLDRVPGATLVATVPAQHMYGLESTVMLALQGGLALWRGRPFYPGDVADALARVPPPRVLVTTPVHLRALEVERVTLPPLALILSATAPLSHAAAAQAERRHGAPVREIYGFTEAGMVASRRTTDGAPWHLLPGVRLRADETGCWAEGGHITTPVLVSDVVERLDDARFVLRGRARDVVNVAGKRASLATLNAHLLAVPGVVDGVFYLPEEDGERVTRLAAFVVAPGLAPRALLGALRERIDPAFLPRPLHFLDALPRSAAGKLPLDVLRRLATGHARR